MSNTKTKDSQRKSDFETKSAYLRKDLVASVEKEAELEGRNFSAQLNYVLMLHFAERKKNSIKAGAR